MLDRGRVLRRGLDELLRWGRLEIVVPDGGALCCLRLPEGVEPGFHDRLAALDTRVAPGSWFGSDDRVFRVGFGHLEIDEFRSALDAVAKAVG